MKKIIFVILIMTFSLSSAQNKYMIYFSDKGDLSKETLSKSLEKNNLAKQLLSKKSIERRKKNLGENYLTFEDLPLETKYVSNLSEKGIKIVNKLKWFNAVSAYLNDEQLEYVKSQKFVKKIEVIQKLKRQLPAKQETGLDKNLSKTTKTYTYNYGNSITQNELSDIPAVHDMGITGEGIRIGVLDSGFDWNDAVSINNSNIIAEHDFVENDNITEDQTTAEINENRDFHGTAVLSILSGFSDGNLIGPAFNSNFVLAKTEDVTEEVNSEEDNYAAALEWMDSIGVDITTSSLGYSEFDANQTSYTYADMDGKTTIVTQAAEFAFSRGIVVITSAGNEGNYAWRYITAPGDGFNTITIGAVTSDNILASFSSRGPTYDGRIKPEIVAQGVSVYYESPASKTPFLNGNGTSYSAPISAGIAGLLLSAYPHLTNKQVRAILLESADRNDSPDNDYGYGLVSALKAITYPNLMKNGTTYTLNKIFDPALDINESTVEMVFADETSQMMNKTDNVFKTDLPALTENENYQFYFRYKDSQGTVHREPNTQNYNFNYGKVYIDLILTEVTTGNEIPDNYYLSQNYPNPFNPVTKIDYAIPAKSSKSFVSLKVYDILGTEIKTLVSEIKSPGKYSVNFSADGISSGIYFYQLHVGDFTQTRKLTILK